MANQKITNLILNVLGVFFLAFGVFAIFYSISRGKPGWVFWLCYVGMILMGFGALTKNSYLILSQLNLLALPLLFWNTDFIYYLATKKNLWGITDYFFGELLWPARVISFEHLFLIPLALVVLYLIKIKKKGAWKLSLIQLTLFFILSRLFTQVEYNVNCVFVSCFPVFPSDFWHPLRWFLIFGSMIIITHLVITSIPIFKKKLT